MTRLVSVTVLMVVLAASRVASAQSTGDTGDTGDTGMLPNGATIQFQHLKTYDVGKQEFVESGDTSDTRRHAFNRASCNCARAHTVASGDAIPGNNNPRSVGWFTYLVVETAASMLHVPATFWTGTGCDVLTSRTGASTTCKRLDYAGLSDLDNQLYSGAHGATESFNLYDLVNGFTHDELNAGTADPGDPNAARCQQLETNVPLWLLISTTGSTDSFDVNINQNIGTLSTDSGTQSTGVDTHPPPLPTDLQALPSDESINLKWTVPTSRNTDIAYYQVLCADESNSVVRSRVSGARYITTQSLCSDAKPADLAEEQITSFASTDTNEHATEVPGGAFGALSEAYICGEATSATANSIKLTGLHNGVPYRLIFLSIDLHGNYSGEYLDHTVTPIPVTDFWEDLHDGNDNPKGGLCLLAETYGDDSSLTNTLRSFRDDTLGGSGAGRWLGRAYYATLGKLGAVVHGSLALRIVAGVVLAPVVALALLWHWLTLPGLLAALVVLGLAWRRRARLGRLAAMLRSRRWAIVGTSVLIVAVAPGLARADKFQPYWENDPLDKSTDAKGAPSDPNYDPTFDSSLETHDNNRSSNPFTDEKERNQDTPIGVAPSTFHVGIKVGPYFPDIDKQAGKSSYGPYRQMFGGYNLMPMIDVDYVLWSNYGQITVGASVGYLQKTANGFVDGSTPGDHSRMRVPGAENKFQLLPTALVAGYRFTYLDDTYGIPLVPYVRGGLSYYVWRVTAPNGEVAQICSGDGAAEQCGNKALGASIGVQGAIGLAIRAERIDAGTAQSMRNSGIQHVGIYGELSIAKVDGFGSDSKLSVGDRTWFAGVDFEF